MNGHQFIVVVSAQWGAGLTNPSESLTQEMLLVTREKRAGEGGSNASAQTLPFFSVPPRLHCAGGPIRTGQKRAAGRVVRIPCEWSVCCPESFSCFGQRAAEDRGGVSVTDGLRVAGAFVDGGACLNRDVRPLSLRVSRARGRVCGGCNGGFD